MKANTKFNRLLALLLTVVILLGMLPITTVLAASEDDNRITITRLELRMTKEAVPKYGASTRIYPTLTLKRALAAGSTEVTDIPDGGVELLSETGGYFSWQVWDAEIESWTNYNEKTFGIGKYRILCRVRLLNAGSDKFAERYKFDGKAGLSAIVYDESASPMTWETRSIVHEKSYSSAVLLSPVYTVASSTAEPLEGRIFFTSAMRTGEAVSVAVSGCNAPAGNMRYRWQRLNEEDGVWYNWSNESTSGGISADDMGYATGTMRLVVTAEGYSGQLVSEERTVIPAASPEQPVAPKLKFLPLDNDSYGRGVVRVTNPAGSWQQQDYLLSENPMTQEQLDAAPTMEEDPSWFYGRWTSYFRVWEKAGNPFLVRPNKHYYVYTRVTKHGGFLPGRTYTYSTIYTGNTEDQIYLTELNLGDYGASGTIYVPIGGQLKLALKKQAPDANQWNYIRLKAYESNPFITEAVPFSMIIDGAEYSNEFLVGVGEMPITGITIKAGDTAGTGYLGAFYPSAGGDYNLSYGKWKIVVYDPANITDYEIVNAPTYGDVTMNVGDTYTPGGTVDAADLTRPAGALEGCTFEWYARVGTAPFTNEPLFFVNDPSYKNDFISVDKTTGEVTALKPHGADDEIFKQVALYAVKGSTKKQLAVYHVTVDANSTEPVLLVNPGSLTMSAGDIESLTAQLIRGEGITDSFTWSSADTSVATVSNTGSKGEVTAVAPGNTTILVKVGDYASAVTVHVHQWGEWTPTEDDTYQRKCLLEGCDATETKKSDEYAITVTDGKATVGAGTPISKATEGTTITLTADAAPTDKVFDKWVVESGSITLANASSATTTFTMPAGAVSVKATYKTAPVATYNLTTQVNGGNGTISAGKTGLTAGSTETVIFTPDSGYEIDTVTVNGVTTPVLSNVLDVTMDTDKTVIVTYKATGGSEHSHSYGSEWKNDADNHWHECSCGDKTDTAAHSFKWVVDKEATATEKGSKHEECTVCGYKKAAVEIPATGTPTKPTDPTDPEKPTKPADSKSPQTGDNSMMSLWIALLFVSGGVLAGTTLYSRKKKAEE